MRTLRLILAGVILVSGGNRLKADDSFTCPVTKASEQTFVPPAPWEPNGPWFGTEKLWTRVQMWEFWRRDQLGYYVPKLAWFSSTFDWTPEHWPKGSSLLTMTGRRLDGPSKPLIFDGANNAYVPDEGPFITTSAHLPTAGCWEITGHYKDENLTFVVKIGL
jgi:hypothetical protein